MAAAIVAVVTPASQVQAGPIGDTGSFQYTRVSGYYPTTGGSPMTQGGEFTLYNVVGLSNADYSAGTSGLIDNGSFQTFCLEVGEYAASSHFVVGTAAARGGTTNSVDPISMGTAYLYSEFAKGTLAGFFNGSRAVEAGLLQMAIWALEGEVAAPVGNAYYNLALANGGATTAAQGHLGVYVLNNFTTAAGRDKWATGTWVESAKAQDFLYYQVPDGGTTLMLLGGALAGLGALRRRLPL